MSKQFDKLVVILKELFQLDQPDLDFGLYRIMHAKADEITQFLEQDLLPQVQEAFSHYTTADKAVLEDQLKKVIEQANNLGVDPETTTKVKELRQRIADDSVDLAALETEVYDHLYRFFRRYYNEGDFLAKRVYKPGVYALPYEGEEVKLHWANRDQYYIKTSEYLRDYAFTLRPFAVKNPMRVHFRLADAAEGEHGNAKAAEGKDRVFVLAPDDFVAEENGALVLRFHYRPATIDDWPEEARQIATAGAVKKPPVQKALLADAVHRVLAIADPALTSWIDELSRKHVKANGEPSDYSRLEGHLNRYCARHTFDYFIHKDLGAFLRRELDFFIKNEIMHLDDVESESAPRVEQYLSKIKVIRKIAHKLIDFLAQLEDFQKKLWLKKKFVVETNFCITLDRVPEEFYSEIAANESQREEWVQLFGIDSIEHDLARPGYAVPLSTEFLQHYQYLVLDTVHFDRPFQQRLLSRLGNIAASVPSLALHCDNFHGLRLIKERFQGRVKTIYLDPPYNTNVSAIPYKNNYKHSSWATMMRDRLDLMHGMLRSDSVCYVSIDKNERSSLEAALDDVFSKDNRIEELIWVQNTNDGRAPTFSTNHEYVLVYAKDRSTVETQFTMFRESKPGLERVMSLVNEIEHRYPDIATIEARLAELYLKMSHSYKEEIEAQGLKWEEEKRNDPCKGLYAYRHAEYRDTESKWVDLSNAKKLKAHIWVYSESDWTIMESDRKQSPTTRDPNHPNYRYYVPNHPITGKPCAMPSRGWKGTQFTDPEYPDRNTWESMIADHGIAFGLNEAKVPRQKRFLLEVETNVAKSVVVDYSDGERETAALFGRTGVFLAPKHTSFVSRFLRQSTNSESVVVDVFGGSGSTASAVLSLNREDDGNRAFVVMEANTYFDELILPRIKKSMFARSWAKGRPVDTSTGLSHAFKYIRLESYEDALNNLDTRRSQSQASLLDSPEAGGSEGLKEEYLLRYMLDVETRGSQSLLNVAAFSDPTAYRLKVKVPGSDESRQVNVDLLETFNYLIGLTVKHIAVPQTFRAAFGRDEESRLHLDGRLKQDVAGPWWFRTVEGVTPEGRKVLVIWRKLTSDAEHDNLVLDEWFTRQGYSTKDLEFDLIFVNGDNNLENLRQPDETWKVRLIEEDFHRLMFDVESV